MWGDIPLASARAARTVHTKSVDKLPVSTAATTAAAFSASLTASAFVSVLWGTLVSVA